MMTPVIKKGFHLLLMVFDQGQGWPFGKELLYRLQPLSRWGTLWNDTGLEKG